MLPLVTIIIPTYNNSSVYDAINSALNQTYINIEFIVVNDYSKRDIDELKLRKYCENNKIKYLFNETNLGYKKNFDFCWSIASGKYVILLHHDDKMCPNMIEKYVKIFELNSNVGAVCCETIKNYNNKLVKQYNIIRSDKEYMIYDTKNFIDLYLTKGHPEIATLMLKTEIIQNNEPLKFYHEKMSFYDDYCFWIDLSIKTNIIKINYPLLIRGINIYQAGHQLREDGKQEKINYFNMLVEYIEWIDKKVRGYGNEEKLNDWIKITLSLYYLTYSNRINKTTLYSEYDKLKIIEYFNYNMVKYFVSFCIALPYPLDFCLYKLIHTIKKIFK